MKKIFILVNCIALIFVMKSCKKQISIPEKPEISIEVVEVETSEVWLKLRTSLEGKGYYILKRNDGINQEGIILGETTIYQRSLFPDRIYRYKAYLRNLALSIIDSTETIEIATNDTTSHDFHWEDFSFGVGHSSVLHDVWIVNENDIWAVGYIYETNSESYDSLGNWIPAYNAIHWDGVKCNLERISFRYPKHSGYTEAVCAFGYDSDGIIVCSGGSFMRWFENAWQVLGLFDPMDPAIMKGAVLKMWGTSFNDLYAVGLYGNIMYYNGEKWRQIESGTDVYISDIWGSALSNTAICIASEPYQSESKILEIDLNSKKVRPLDWPYDNKNMSSVWYKNNNIIWVCGSKIYKRVENKWYSPGQVSRIYLNRIRGNDNNDIFVAGDFGLVSHYNGKSWHRYKDVFNARYYSLDFKKDLMVAVGARDGKAIILMMRRSSSFADNY